MKRFFIFAAVLVATCASAGAQTAQRSPFDREKEVFANNPDALKPGMKYLEMKNLYQLKDYDYLSKPLYSPARAWLNLTVPGVAQFTMGEMWLGLAYLGGALVSESIFALGQFHIDEGLDQEGIAFEAIGVAGYITATTLSIVNAMKVAKIKSLHASDMNNLNKNYSFSVTPTIIPSYSLSGMEFTPGIGMTLRF